MINCDVLFTKSCALSAVVGRYAEHFEISHAIDISDPSSSLLIN